MIDQETWDQLPDRAQWLAKDKAKTYSEAAEFVLEWEQGSGATKIRVDKSGIDIWINGQYIGMPVDQATALKDMLPTALKRYASLQSDEDAMGGAVDVYA